MRNKIKLLNVFRYPLSSWEGFRRGGKHIRPGLLLGHTLSRVQRKPVAGGEHYHKVVKHLETTEEPDNLQNKTPLLESQATIFKAHCFRRTHTKYVIQYLPAVKCLLHLLSSISPPLSCHFAGKFISHYLYSGEQGPFNPLTSLCD